MGGRTKRTIRTKGNCLEVNVEILVFDDLLGPAVLVVGVTIGASSTYLTRQGVDGRVDGGVGDADVKENVLVCGMTMAPRADSDRISTRSRSRLDCGRMW